ncbi:MAG: beta-N-acetylglucosaminidase domain-containing protein [Clostridia bacterium]|nr:beta-N-acetylglucosaminidase domain-containing protein [Clostridia bacterium]
MYREFIVLTLVLLMAASILFSCRPGTVPEPTQAPYPTPDPDDPWQTSSGYSGMVPAPVSFTVSEDGSKTADASLLTPSSSDYDGIFTNFGFSVGANGLPVQIELTGGDGSGSADESYKLSVKNTGVTVTASSKRGIYNAVSTLAQLRDGDKLLEAEVEDSPAVAIRGVIEGFYGTAWTHEFRLDLFRFMGKYKLNTYIYAPKDDPKHRAQWRELYTGEELEKMSELVNCAEANNVRFVYAISPGLDINLGAKYEKDLQTLFDKCEFMYNLGVRSFSILLDDITTLDAEGHAKLLNDFQNRFVKTHEGCDDLIMISPEFCDAMLTSYSDKLAPLLQSDIIMMWTGAGVAPFDLNERQITKANDKFGREMLLWWNYPVNDTMPDLLFLSPMSPFKGNAAGSIGGLVANPMNQGYASELPLITVADYLWNPAGYDAEESLKTAAKKLVPECPEGLLTLSDLCRGTLATGSKSSTEFTKAVKKYDYKDAASAETFRATLEGMKANLALLREKAPFPLVSEIKKWIEKAETGINCALELIAFDTSAAGAEKFEHAAMFVYYYEQAAKNTVSVSKDSLFPLLTGAKNRVNSVLGENAADVESAVSASTTLNTYENFNPENAIDGDASTYFWSAGAPAVDSTFTVDLGSVVKVSGVTLKTGEASHTGDYMHSGVIEYSTDGNKYTKLCDVKKREVSDSTEFCARYVRLRCTKAQDNWLIITEFDISTGTSLPESVSFSGDSIKTMTKLFDGNIFSVFSPKFSAVAGKTLTIDTKNASKVTMILLRTEGIHVFVDKAGTDPVEVALSPCTVIDISGADSLRIEFGNTGCDIAEISIE